MEVPQGATKCGHCQSSIAAVSPKHLAIGCGSFLVLGLAFAGCLSLLRDDNPASPDGDAPLAASAACQVGRVVIENNSPDIWRETIIRVNGTWEYKPDVVIPGRQPFMPALFTKSDGTRLDLADVTCQRIDIHATINGKRRHWNGAR